LSTQRCARLQRLPWSCCCSVLVCWCDVGRTGGWRTQRPRQQPGMLRVCLRVQGSGLPSRPHLSATGGASVQTPGDVMCSAVPGPTRKPCSGRKAVDQQHHVGRAIGGAPVTHRACPTRTHFPPARVQTASTRVSPGRLGGDNTQRARACLVRAGSRGQATTQCACYARCAAALPWARARPAAVATHRRVRA
jgi:hypothetical protein